MGGQKVGLYKGEEEPMAAPELVVKQNEDGEEPMAAPEVGVDKNE